MTFSYRHIATPIGMMYAIADATSLHELGFLDEQKALKINAIEAKHHAILDLLMHQLDEYFTKKRDVFDIPLSLKGTSFQKEVWRSLLSIPYATTISYKALAISVFRDKAYRAVANANANNLISIIIPCHRVISSDGSIGGYSGGIERKQWLLSHEGFSSLARYHLSKKAL